MPLQSASSCATVWVYDLQKRLVEAVNSFNKLLKGVSALLGALLVALALPSQAGAVQVDSPLNNAGGHRSVLLKHTNNLFVRNIVGQAGDHSATVTWDVPLEPYGSQVVAYSVVANYKDPVSGKRVTTDPVSVTDVTLRRATITGLLNGVWNDFTITARSNTEWSAVNTNNVKNGGMVKPSGLPCAASTVTAVPGNKRVTVKWNRPCNGGATVTFSVTTLSSSQSFGVISNIADNHTAPSATVKNLINGVPYSFTVTSTNANGSVVSVTSSVVTPRP